MKTNLEKPKWLTKENLIVVVLVGVLLLVICFPLDRNESDVSDMNSSIMIENTEKEPLLSETTQITYGIYRSEMEQQVKAILSTMEGVGKVEVLLTLQSSEELVVEKDTRIVRDNTDESGESGSVSFQSVDSEETTVFSQSGSNGSEPYVVKTIQPKVEGVLVIAEGAGRGEVNKNITEAIQVLFGIESHKIKVAKMKSN